MYRPVLIGQLLNSSLPAMKKQGIDMLRSAIAKAGSISGAAEVVGASVRSVMRWSAEHKLVSPKGSRKPKARLGKRIPKSGRRVRKVLRNSIAKPSKKVARNHA